MGTEIADAPTRNLVRGAVRGLLERTEAFPKLPKARQTALANNLVRLTETQLDLMAEEQGAEAEPPLAMAQQTFDPQANTRVAQQTQDVVEAIGFPRFVTELVNGVFKGLIDANAQQMQAYVDMISGVTAASADSAEATGPGPARIWLVQNFPDSYALGAAKDLWGETRDGGGTLVTLQDGKDAPKAADISALLELDEDAAAGLDPDEPETSLLPKVRAFLSRQKQKVLASLLTLGMNRIVIDHGKIKAGMNFSIDAKSAAEENKARRFDLSNTTSGSGSFGTGPWGVNASMTNSIGLVRTNQNHTREDLTSKVNMNADVELHFRSDYVPLNTLAAADSVQRIRAVSLNPKAQAPGQMQGERTGPTLGKKAASKVISSPTVPQGAKASTTRPKAKGPVRPKSTIRPAKPTTSKPKTAPSATKAPQKRR